MESSEKSAKFTAESFLVSFEYTDQEKLINTHYGITGHSLNISLHRKLAGAEHHYLDFENEFIVDQHARDCMVTTQTLLGFIEFCVKVYPKWYDAELWRDYRILRNNTHLDQFIKRLYCKRAGRPMTNEELKNVFKGRKSTEIKPTELNITEAKSTEQKETELNGTEPNRTKLNRTKVQLPQVPDRIRLILTDSGRFGQIRDEFEKLTLTEIVELFNNTKNRDICATSQVLVNSNRYSPANKRALLMGLEITDSIGFVYTLSENETESISMTNLQSMIEDFYTNEHKQKRLHEVLH